MRKHIFVLFLLSATICKGQFLKELDYGVETGVSFSGGKHTPLWLTANKHGLGSIQKNNGYLMAGVFRPMEKDKTFSYELGLELVGAYNFESNFYVRQAYVDLKWHFLGLSVGSKMRNGELKNQELSSGALTFSGNSLPIPQVRIGIPDYVAIPGTKEWFSVKGHIAYGIFTDGRWQEDFTGGKHNYVKKALFHDKAIYFKIGDGKFPLILEGGLEMPARFSGTAYSYNASKQEMKVVDIPHRLKDFWNVLIPSKGDSETLGMDQTNIIGDMLGSWNFSLTYNLKDWKLRAYFEHQYNDHSQLFGEYGWKDGLWGAEVTLPKNPFVSCLVYEYLYSKDQTGPVYHDTDKIIPDQISGSDDYYNHGVYSGWQHWGMAIGNPLFVSPVYNENGSLYFRSNRIIANHVGITGNPTDEFKYRVLFSHARHWGTYSNPLPDIKYNINVMAELAYSPKALKHWTFIGSIAGDKSDYITGNSLGGMLTIRFNK